ncbi:MAG: hypothetical protein R3E32_11300 [Chitinophagales bacterium]
MKHFISKALFLLVMGLLVNVTGVWAQKAAPATANPNIQVLTPKERAERKAAQMTKQYQLTPAQSQKVIDIYLGTNKDLREARQTSYKTPQAKKAAMKQAKQDRTQAIRAMLTPTQRQKMDELTAQRMAKQAESKAKRAAATK